MPHNFTGLTAKDNNFKKGTFLDSFDEPTYLTFALDFNFDETPATTDVDEANLWNSPLFSKGGSSASSFLLGRGYAAQADGLATFKGILKHLTYNAPWYFQEVEGLKELFKDNTDMSKGFKTSGNVLKIKTLEAVDLRIAEIAGLYRNAIYDMKHRRERVPDNLRWFSVDVYVAEFRNLRYRIPGEGQTLASTLGVDTAAIGAIVGGGNVISNVMDQYGFIKFKCRQCEFDFSKSLPTGQAIKVNAEGRNQETNQFDIKIGWVEEESKYGDGTRLYEDPTRTSINNPWGSRKMAADIQNGLTFLSNLPVVGESIKTAGQKVTDGLSKVGGLINPALKSAVQFLNPPVELDDVYTGDSAYVGEAETESETKKIGDQYTNDNPVSVLGTSVVDDASFDEPDQYTGESINGKPKEYTGVAEEDSEIKEIDDQYTGTSINGKPNEYTGKAEEDSEIKEIDDQYKIGYAKNGDTVPSKEDPPNGNVYI